MEDDRGRYYFNRISSKYFNNLLRAAGDAYVELETLDDQDDALRMHKRDMGTRFKQNLAKKNRQLRECVIQSALM